LADDPSYGYPESNVIGTPNLKRMEAEGMSMTSSYASDSVCSPSRASLLTCCYPVRTLITNPLLSTNDSMNILMDVLGRYSFNVQDIPRDEVLLPVVPKRRGYQTALVGKRHPGGTAGYSPNDRGF
jgi:arylsulfatase A